MEEIRAGRLWKARDRLRGLSLTFPSDQRILDLLGEVHYKMDDLPEAGRYWYLTARTGSEVEAALTALRERYPTPASLGPKLPIRASLELFPEVVRRRVEGEDPALLGYLHPKARRPAEEAHRSGHPPDPLTPPSSSAWGAVAWFVSFLVTLLLIGHMSSWSNGWVYLGIAAYFLGAHGLSRRERRRRQQG